MGAELLRFEVWGRVSNPGYRAVHQAWRSLVAFTRALGDRRYRARLRPLPFGARSIRV